MNLQQSRQDLNVGVLKIKCAFWNSSTAVSFSEVSGDITFERCQFASNALCGLKIKDSGTHGYRFIKFGSTFDANKCTGSAFTWTFLLIMG